MTNELFIQSPTRELYELNQQDIHEDSLVFIEDTKEIIAKNKSYQTLPDGGNEGLMLTKTEDGAEWTDFKNIDISVEDDTLIINTL